MVDIGATSLSSSKTMHEHDHDKAKPGHFGHRASTSAIDLDDTEKASEPVVSLPSFRSVLEHHGWDGADPAAVFAALDTKRRDGALNYGEFVALELFCAMSAMTAAEGFRNHLLTAYEGKMKDAFKLMDENGSGSVSKEEFIHAAAKIPGYSMDRHAAERVFRFLDLDGSNVIGLKEFEELRTLDTRHFLEELHKACRQIKAKYASFAKAFETFGVKTGSENRLTVKEMKEGWKRLGLEKACELRPLLLFSFLDDNDSGAISLQEWRLLEAFDARSACRFLQELRYLFEDVEVRDGVEAFRRILKAAENGDP